MVLGSMVDSVAASAATFFICICSSCFLAIWVRNRGVAYIVVIPLILVIAPQVQKLVDLFFKRLAK